MNCRVTHKHSAIRHLLHLKVRIVVRAKSESNINDNLPIHWDPFIWMEHNLSRLHCARHIYFARGIVEEVDNICIRQFRNKWKKCTNEHTSTQYKWTNGWIMLQKSNACAGECVEVYGTMCAIPVRNVSTLGTRYPKGRVVACSLAKHLTHLWNASSLLMTSSIPYSLHPHTLTLTPLTHQHAAYPLTSWALYNTIENGYLHP